MGREYITITIPKGGRPPKAKPADDDLRTLYASHTQAEIAALYSVSKATVTRWLRKAGITCNVKAKA